MNIASKLASYYVAFVRFFAGFGFYTYFADASRT